MQKSVFEAESGAYKARVFVDECNKIYCVNIIKEEKLYSQPIILVWDTDRTPMDDDFSSFVDKAFETIMSSEIETFKAMLMKIKDSEPEYYQKGIEMLENKKKALLEEAKKYSIMKKSDQTC